MERVEELKYLGPQLDQKDDDWMSILWNIKRYQKVWDPLRNMMYREGGDTQV